MMVYDPEETAEDRAPTFGGIGAQYDEDPEDDGYTCDDCGEVVETAQQLVGHHVAEHGLKPG